ncbi:MAG: hypothetical protein LBE75_04320 [Burkholderiales bacterium]|nr:hypothetical protein [Burkholderiales bacterium]
MSKFQHERKSFRDCGSAAKTQRQYSMVLCAERWDFTLVFILPPLKPILLVATQELGVIGAFEFTAPSFIAPTH